MAAYTNISPCPNRRFGRTPRAGHDAAMYVCMFEAQAPTLHQQMHAPTFTGLAADSCPHPVRWWGRGRRCLGCGCGVTAAV